MSKNIDAETLTLKQVLFKRADYFARNFALSVDDRMQSEYRTKFIAIFEAMMDANLDKEYSNQKS